MVTALCITSLDQGKIVPKHYFEIKSDDEIAAMTLKESQSALRIESVRNWLVRHLSSGQETVNSVLRSRLLQKQLS